MGCANSKAKKARRRDTLSQEAERETAKEREVAAAEEREVAAEEEHEVATSEEPEAATPSAAVRAENAVEASVSRTTPSDTEAMISAAPLAKAAATTVPDKDRATGKHWHHRNGLHASKRTGRRHSNHVSSRRSSAPVIPSRHVRRRSTSSSRAEAAPPSEESTAAAPQESSGSADSDSPSGTSPSSDSFEKSKAVPAGDDKAPETDANLHPDQKSASLNAGATPTPSPHPQDSTSVRRDGASPVPSSHPRDSASVRRDGAASFVPPSSVNAGPMAAVRTTSVSSRVSFEPYTAAGLSNGDDGLPPFEWALRTMAVPPPLHPAGPADDVAAPHWRGHDIGGHDAPTAAVRFHDPVVQAPEPESVPLAVHTFYPSPAPPARWSGSAVGASDRGFAATTLYSPAELREQKAQSRLDDMPPSLVDVYVSGESAYQSSYPPAPPPQQHKQPVLAPYQHYPVSAPAHRYADPVPDARAAEMMTADNSYILRDADLSRSVHGVGAHQYKPVTYLFDSPTDGWLRSRRVPSPPPQRLYAGAAALW